MAEINKRIIIDADTSGVSKAFEDMQNSGNILYSRLKREAQEYSDNLKLQSQYIDRLLSLESRRANEYNAQIKRQLELSKEEALAKATSYNEKQIIEKEFEEKLAKQKRYFTIEQQQLLEAKQMADMEYSRFRGMRVRDFEQQEEVEGVPLRTTIGRTTGRLGRTLFGIGTAATAGLGIGFAFGIAGLLYEMVKSAAELDKSMVALRATMDSVDKSSLGAASSIGKTSAQMADLTRQAAILSGGELGTLTGVRTLQLAQFAKAFGLEEGLLLQQLPIGRMGGADIGKELLDLLREMLKTGTVTKDNMSKLGEKIDFWNRLNQMQSQQLIAVSPAISTYLLGALEQTGLPILSDQRQFEFLEKINQSLTNPRNEYIRAYNLSNLSRMTGGDLIETLKLEEQGIFGKGVLRSAFEQYEKDFAQGRRADAIISLSRRFGLSIQESEMLFNEMFADTENAREKRRKFLESIDRITELNEQYIMISKTDDVKRKRQLETEYNATKEQLRKEFGINVPELAGGRTAISESVIATYNNIMANSGSKVLKNIGNLLTNPNVVESVNLLAQGISYAAAELINVAAKILNEAAKMFNEAVQKIAPIIKALFGGGKEEVPEDVKLRNASVDILSDLYGYANFEQLPDYKREEIKKYISKYIDLEKGVIIKSDFSESEFKSLSDFKKKLYMDYFFDPSSQFNRQKNPKTGLYPFGRELWIKKNKEFEDLPIENKEKSKDQSSLILLESMRDLTKAIKDNSLELKRSNFIVPGVYSEAYG